MKPIATVLGLALLWPAAVLPQAFPSKPLRIIVPTSPGGLNDLLSRTLGQQIAESIGQPVIVENRPGASSFIGMTALAKSAPDGYTVGITTAEPLVYNPLLFSKLPYDPDNDFTYVTQLVKTLGVIIAPASAPFNTFPEMIAYARAHPGALNWATWGPASTPAMYLEWIKRQNNVDIAAIPYKGAGPSIPATISGQVHVTYTGIGLVVSAFQAGKLKALAIANAEQASALPGVPPLHRFNSDPGLVSGFSVYAPGKTPAPLLERLSAEFRKALNTRAVDKVLEGTMVAVGNTPAEFAAAMKVDRANAARVFQALGIKPADAPAN